MTHIHAVKSRVAPAGAARTASRLTNRFFLESALTLADTFGGDLTLGMVFLAVSEANVEHIAADSTLARTCAMDGLPMPDHARRPVTIYQISKSLGLTYDTARRYVAKLVERGLCERNDSGLVVTSDILNKPAISRGAARNAASLSDLIRCAALYDLF